jgi:hypothetical protein
LRKNNRIKIRANESTRRGSFLEFGNYGRSATTPVGEGTAKAPWNVLLRPLFQFAHIH